VVRFRDLSGDRLARAEIEARYGLLLTEVEAMRAMLAAAPMPVWIRDARGRLAWLNAAYAAAVEANDPAGAIARGLELLDSPRRPQAARAGRLPHLARRPPLRLPFGRGARAMVAPARRADAPRHRQSQSAGRDDLDLRERHRAPRPREPLQFADPRPGRDARP